MPKRWASTMAPVQSSCGRVHLQESKKTEQELTGQRPGATRSFTAAASQHQLFDVAALYVAVSALRTSQHQPFGLARTFAKFFSKVAMLTIFPFREISCEI